MDLDFLVLQIWLLTSTSYIFLYQWWYTWYLTGVLPDDTWIMMILLALIFIPSAVDVFSPGFLDWWYDGAQIIHDNILTWLLSDMRPLGFLKWILVLLGLVLYTTVVQ
nr:MAG: ORF7 protein [Jingmen bat alphacoronavirus 2]